MTATVLSFVNTIQRRSLVVGGLGVALCGIGLATSQQQFFMSYLFAFLFWFGIAMGSLGILMLHHVTGGAWGDLIKPQLESASMTVPLLGILFIPVLFGLKALFPWARPDLVAADPILGHKSLYLNVPFFTVRAVLYFTLWSVMAHRLKARWGAPGLVVYTLTLSFAVLDWMMSLEPDWYSTIYEIMVIVGFMLTAFAFVAGGLRLLQRPEDRRDPAYVKPYWDLGNMILTFVMLWAYMAFSQYLIIWSGNMPEEISWYLRRQDGGWFWLIMLLIFFQFILPFLMLLGRRQKQKIERLAWITVLIVTMGILNLFWLVMPAFYPGQFHVSWFDGAAFVGVGGLWLAVFLAFLKKSPAMVGTYVPEEG